MQILPQSTTVDNHQQVISAPTTVYWGTNDEIVPLDGLRLPDLLRTRGPVGDRLDIDPALVLAFQMKAILVIPVIHLGAPRRHPFGGHLHLLDLLKHGTLQYGDDGAPRLVFPASIVRYPEKKSKSTRRRCNARRGTK